jgi:hypothetical protein
MQVKQRQKQHDLDRVGKSHSEDSCRDPALRVTSSTGATSTALVADAQPTKENSRFLPLFLCCCSCCSCVFCSRSSCCCASCDTLSISSVSLSLSLSLRVFFFRKLKHTPTHTYYTHLHTHLHMTHRYDRRRWQGDPRRGETDSDAGTAGGREGIPGHIDHCERSLHDQTSATHRRGSIHSPLRQSSPSPPRDLISLPRTPGLRFPLFLCVCVCVCVCVNAWVSVCIEILLF